MLLTKVLQYGQSLCRISEDKTASKIFFKPLLYERMMLVSLLYRGFRKHPRQRNSSDILKILSQCIFFFLSGIFIDKYP